MWCSSRPAGAAGRSRSSKPTSFAGNPLRFFLIFLNFSPILVNLIGSAVFALLIPYVAIGRTLLYFDLKASEEAEEAAGLTRRYWFSRPRPAMQTG